MIHRRAGWQIKMRGAALALITAALPFAYGPAVQAQSIMRSPNLSVGARIPTINPTVTPRIDPNIAARAFTGSGSPTGLRTYSGCNPADRNSDGGVRGPSLSSPHCGGTGGSRHQTQTQTC